MSATIANRPTYQTVEAILKDFTFDGSTGLGAELQSVQGQSAAQYREVTRAVSLTEQPEAIRVLRGLRDGWDGRDAEAPSELVLSHAEAFWKAIETMFSKSYPKPSVRMCRDGYVSFSWVDAAHSKELHIWFHDEEPITYESHLSTKDSRSDIAEASPRDLRQALVQYFQA